MKKITFLLLSAFMLVFSWQASAQFSFPAVAGPTNVANGSPVTLNINDAANSAGVTIPSSGTYDSFSVSVDWTNDNNAYSSEADLTMNTTGSSVLINPPSTGSAASGSATTMTFDGDFDVAYDPAVDGTLDIILNQSWGGSSADWSNIVVTLFPTVTDTLDFYNLQWPGSGAITNGDSYTVYAQCYEAGLTDVDATPSAGIEAWIGYSTTNATTAADFESASWTWVAATTNPGYDFTQNNDEYVLDLDAELGPGTYYYVSRWSLNGGPFTYGGFDGGAWDGTTNTSGLVVINPGPGEECSSAISLAIESDCSTATPYSLDFTSATDIGSAGSCDTTTGNIGAWFQFIAPPSGAITLTNSGSDNEYVIYDACGGTEIECGNLSASNEISGLTPATIYKMAIWKDSFYTMTVDDFCLEEITCPDPSGMSAANVTATSADLTWTSGAGESDWNLEWKAGADFTPGNSEEDASDTASGTPAYNATMLTPDTTYYIYYQADCGGGDASNWVGPFVGTTLATCPDPSGMTVNPTSSVADLSWTIGDSETSWNLEWKAGADFTPGNSEEDASDTAATNTNHFIFGLTANTEYYLYYQADCTGGDFSNWVGPVVFTTLCDAIVPDYTADMSNNPADSCWNEAENGDPSSGPTGLGSSSWYASNHNGTPSNAINLWLASKSDWIISPIFDLSTAAPSELKVYVALTENSTNGSGADLGSDDEVRLVMSTDLGATWTTLQSWVQGSVPTDVGEEITYDLSAITGNVQFAFWGSEGTVDDTEDVYFHVSSFIVQETPSCEVPTSLVTADITTTSADFTWAAGLSGETDWEYALVAGGSGEPVSGTPTSTASYSDTSLTPNTNYDFYVRANCGGGDYSAWIMTSIYTGYCIPAAGTSSSTYVDNFSTTNGGMNISNLASGYSTDSYGDFTAQSVSQASDQSFDFNLEIVGGTLGVAIWVDWNNDLTFDPGTETVYNTTSYGSGPFTGTITVPSATPDGDYTMRVMVDWYDPDPSDDPCQTSGTTTRFEVEDYTLTVDATLGSENFTQNGFKYYPNPVNDNLSLRAQQNIQNVSVFNMLGQEVLRVAPNALSSDVNMSNLNAGAYFVKVTINQTTETIKVIKN